MQVRVPRVGCRNLGRPKAEDDCNEKFISEAKEVGYQTPTRGSDGIAARGKGGWKKTSIGLTRSDNRQPCKELS
jgi:hypothetical protein